MEKKKLIVSASPHITSHETTRGIMLNVCAALLPALIASSLIFGARALLVTGVTVASCVGFEALYCILLKKPVPVGDFSAVVTGMILAFNLPVSIPLWIAIIGAFVAIVVAKQLFGGLGHNFANPALLGRIVLFISFAGRMTAYTYPETDVDVLATATPLVAGAQGKDIIVKLLLGTHGGMLGETCAAALLLGGLYLIATKTISAAIPLSYIGTVAVLSLILGQDVLLQLLSGGLMLGAFFMATDYVTSPFTFKGRIVYGICLGVLTCLIRFFGNMAEGVSFALLLMNLLVPYLNELTRQKPLGGVKAK